MSSSGQTTISDVARAAKVGTSTVSRVINGGHRVAPEARRRVEAAMQKLHYQPNGAARSLARARNQSIGLIVPQLSDPFFANIASVLQGVCRLRDYILLISASSDTEEQTLEELKIMQQQRVEGFLIVPPARQSPSLREYCDRFTSRAVTIDQPIHRSSISSVLTDNADAAAVLTEHLIGHDCKRILFIGGDPEHYTLRERRRGYTEAMEAAGLPAMVAEEIFTSQAMDETLLRCCRGKSAIDGVFTANNTLAMLAYKSLRRLGIAIPDDVALVTYGDFAMADVLSPSVTCMAQQVDEMARAAGDLLFRQLDSSKGSEQRVQLPSRLILRESCGCKSQADSQK